MAMTYKEEVAITKVKRLTREQVEKIFKRNGFTPSAADIARVKAPRHCYDFFCIACSSSDTFYGNISWAKKQAAYNGWKSSPLGWVCDQCQHPEKYEEYEEVGRGNI